MAFEFPIRIYWEDTDAGGVVFYANYLKFFERARTEWLRALGYNQQVLREQVGGMFVVSEAQVKYHRPARLDDELIVTASLIDHGRASITLAQKALKIERVGDTVSHTLLCEGSVRAGWIDAHSFKPAKIPQPVLDALQ